MRILLLVFAYFIFGSSFAAADIRSTIAQRFGVEPDSFVLNLPPRPGCLPGSIFTEDLRVPMARTDVGDPDLQFGPTFQFSATLNTDADAQASGGVAAWFGLSVKASDAAAISIEFSDARVVEILGPALKRRVLADQDALAASARKVPPFAVLRAFQGKATVRLTKKTGASAEAWADLRQAAAEVKAGVSVSGDDAVAISIAEPFVFGFEVVRLNYVTENLGTTVTDVVLAPVPEDLFSR